MEQINKKDLAAAVASEVGISQASAVAAVNAIFDQAAKALAEGKNVDIHSFGKLTVTERPARTGYNPKTREPIAIPATKVVKFKPSSALKKAVQG